MKQSTNAIQVTHAKAIDCNVFNDSLLFVCVGIRCWGITDRGSNAAPGLHLLRSALLRGVHESDLEAVYYAVRALEGAQHVARFDVCYQNLVTPQNQTLRVPFSGLLLKIVGCYFSWGCFYFLFIFLIFPPLKHPTKKKFL